jgi:transcriptional regulator with XRE-family HTH domain
MEQLEDPQFREELEKLEVAYQVARLRVLRGLTQGELARRIGTTQSSISRLESGSREPTTVFLRRIARALDARLEIALVPNDAAGAEHTVALRGLLWYNGGATRHLVGLGGTVYAK